LIKLRNERQSHAAFDLDDAAMRLLELIALSHLNVRPLSVSEAIKIKSSGTAPTVRRNIDLLVDLGLIEQFFIGTNKRTKYLKPTKLAIDFLGSVGQSMMKAVAR
jgi:Fe2+ or Zn2+ uptake regulation protein